MVAFVLESAHFAFFCLVAQSFWPQVEFEISMSETDVMWKEDQRETICDIQHRVSRFLSWLVKRPESLIAVVSHGVWMETLFHSFDPAVMMGGARVHNCDAFCCHVVSVEGEFIRIDRSQHISGHPR